MSLIRVCSICKSPGVTKSTCPLNKNAKNKNYKLHVNATKKINNYLKKKGNDQKIQKQKIQKQKMTKSINIPTLPKIVVLDNDECLGQFGLFSCLYVYSRMTRDPYKVDLTELKNSCVKYLFPNGIARPYLKELFILLKNLKNQGKLNAIVMYTSAPNNLSDGKSGYVYFLKDCIELYCNCPHIYDKVLHRNNVVAKISKCGATIKDLGNVLLTNQQRKVLAEKDTIYKRKLNHKVNTMTHNIIMVDDKPKNIRVRSGRAIGIYPYEYEGNSILFKKCINSVPNLRKKLEYYRDPENNKLSVYQGILREADVNYKKYYGQKNINDLIKIIKIIKRKFI
tara:strand:- start:5933 stop:6946 length:1014 start_codon:yes stop_codon:yes gene_type:complete